MSYNSDFFREIAKKYHISDAIVKRIGETISEASQLEETLHSITRPPQYYHFRINLTRTTSVECLKFAQQAFSDQECILGKLPNSIKVKIHGPFAPKLEEKRIYVDKFAAESIMMGANLFLPGTKLVDAKFERDEPISLMLYTKDVESEFTFTPAECHVATGRAAISSQEFPKHTKGTFVENTTPKYKSANFRTSTLFQQGWISEHNFPPMVAAMMLIDRMFQDQNEDGAKIIELCAAPGHKTAAMAEWGAYRFAQNQKKAWPNILAIDRSNIRFNSLREEIPRLGLEKIELKSMRLEKALHQWPELKESANYILLDPPCSALGTRPKLYLHHTVAELENYVTNQQRILPYADKYLRSGGVLMYNTCTIPKEENEEMIAYFVNNLNYKILDPPAEYRIYAQPGLQLDTFSKTESNKLMRFYPHLEEGIGYFAALLQKP